MLVKNRKHQEKYNKQFDNDFDLHYQKYGPVKLKIINACKKTQSLVDKYNMAKFDKVDRAKLNFMDMSKSKQK